MKRHRTASYFDSVARKYAMRSRSLPWRFIRMKESVAVLRNLREDLSGMNVLDACCGSGYYTEHLLSRRGEHIVAIDISQNMIASLDLPGVTAVHGDICSVALDWKFDLILCAGGMEFMESPAEFFRWAGDHAAEAAKLLVLAPRKSLAGLVYQAYHRLHGLKISLLERDDIEALADSSGWHPVNHELVHAYAQLFLFASDEASVK